MPVYVWPAKERYEYRLLDSGITGLTDNLNPELHGIKMAFLGGDILQLNHWTRTKLTN